MQLRKMTNEQLIWEARYSLDALAHSGDNLVFSEIMEILEELSKREAWTYHDEIIERLDYLGSIEEEDYSEED